MSLVVLILLQKKSRLYYILFIDHFLIMPTLRAKTKNHPCGSPLPGKKKEII